MKQCRKATLWPQEEPGGIPGRSDSCVQAYADHLYVAAINLDGAGKLILPMSQPYAQVRRFGQMLVTK